MARRRLTGQVISASRRTDLPAFHPRWLSSQLRQGRTVCLNPRTKTPYEVDLSPQSVHTLVLWSRNFTPLLPEWDRLRPYRTYLMLTLTGLPSWLEPGAPTESEVLSGLNWLSRQLPPGAVAWRYDPVILGPGCPPEERLETFHRLASLISPFGIKRVIVSFLKPYSHLSGRLPTLYNRRLDPRKVAQIAGALADTAARFGMRISVCAEPELSGISAVDQIGCIDARVLEEVFEPGATRARDTGQRRDCLCTRSRDIGSYEQPCDHGCLYCYAQNPS